MRDLEERLSAILVAEADRHEPPVFDAYGIAESAVRKAFWRRRPVLLLAAIGLAGATGTTGVVVAASGRGDQDRVTVTFQSPATWSDNAPISTDVVQKWLRGRVRAEGLEDVDITVRQSPLTVLVSGHAADVARLRMLDVGGHVVIGRMLPDDSRPLRPPNDCVATQEFGPPVQNCDETGRIFTFTLKVGTDDMHVASAHAEHRRPGAAGWAVVAQFDAGTTQDYRAFTRDVAASHGRIEVTVDGRVVLGQPTITSPVVDGVLVSEAAFTEQQAKDLATALETPGPWQVGVSETSVVRSPHGTG